MANLLHELEVVALKFVLAGVYVAVIVMTLDLRWMVKGGRSARRRRERKEPRDEA
jgi:hypothetical protein